MRLVRLTCAIAALALVACGGGGDDGGGGDGDGGNGMGGGDDYVTVTGIAPDHGPLPGGNTVIVSGTGFTRINAAPNMLLIDGRIALNVSVLTDTEIEVTMPPGMQSGSVDVTLFNNNGAVTVADAYSYNPLPTVTALSPDTGDAAGGDTVTVTGTGFQNLEAGTNVVWFGDLRATVSNVASDTQMTVTAPAGTPLQIADVTVENDNGAASFTGFFYTTAELVTIGHGFTNNNGEMLLVQTADAATTSVRPPFLSSDQRIAAVAVGNDGIYMTLRQAGLARLGFDGEFTVLSNGNGCSRSFSALAFHGGTLYAVCHNNPAATQFGSFDVTTGVFTPIGGSSLSSRPNLVSDGTNLYLLRGGNIDIIDVATGNLSGNVVHNLGTPRGATFNNGTLYVLNRGLAGKGGSSIYGLYTMIPATGATALVGVVPADVHGLVSR